MKIGLYDSGIGGLSVLQEAYHLLPDEEYIFYADTDHVPYGLKTSEEILQYAGESVGFLIEKGVDAVVIACNTATSVAVKPLRERFELPIISMEPAVKPAVEYLDAASEESEDKRVLVIATPVTLREEKLRRLIERVDVRHRVDLLPMPRLVEFAEKEQFGSEETKAYLKERFAGLNTEKYGALVLGCTHFNYFKDMYKSFFPENTRIFDGNEGTIRQLARCLSLSPVNNDGDMMEHIEADDIVKRTEYYTSGRRVDNPEVLEHFRRLHVRLEDMRCLR